MNMTHPREAVPVEMLPVPFLHPKVDLSCVDASGNLAQGVDNSIQIGSKNYLIYPTPLGRGGFGRVLLAQDQDTKKWYAIKEQRIKSEKDLYMVRKEAGYLTKLNEDNIEANKTLTGYKKNQSKYYIVMPLAPGSTVHNLSRSGRDMPTIRWLQIAHGILESISILHAKDILHRDIKGDNIMYDPASGRVTPIDLGLATTKSNPTHDVVGASAYMAPECWEGTYNEKSDVYNTGIVLAELFQLTKIIETMSGKRKIGIVDRDDDQFINNSRISNPQVRAMVRDYLLKMTSSNPDKRPTLDEAKNFFTNVIQNHLWLLAKMYTKGLLDVREYLQATPEEQKQFREALKKCDEVVFIETGKPPLTNMKYIKLRREMEENAILVSHSLYRGSDMLSISDRILTQQPDASFSINNFFYITQKENALPQIPIIQVKVDKKSRDYGDEIIQHLSSTLVSKQHVSVIVKWLQDEITRLESQHLKGKKEAIIKKRIFEINQTIQILNTKADSQLLTYTVLHSSLNVLQNQMLATSHFAQFMKKHFGYRSTSTGSKKIKSAIESEEKQLTRFLNR